MRIPLLVLVGCKDGLEGVPPDASDAVQLPGGEDGIGLDDLRYSRALHAIVVAAGPTGNVVLVDPDTVETTVISGFTTAAWRGGDEEGVQSADEGAGFVWAVDRAAYTLSVVDPVAREIVFTLELEHTEPDYVRYDAPNSEVWISNYSRSRLEVLTVAQGDPPEPAHAAFVDVVGGPEGLTLDPVRRRAYTRAFGGDVVVLDLDTRAEVERWSTGCSGAHGIPHLDEEEGFVFVGCSDAEAVVLDADDGTVVDRYALGSGPSILAWSQALRHLYLRGDGQPTVAFLDVAPDGTLTPLREVESTDKGHCMVADESDQLWVCDWNQGRLLVFADEPTP